MQIRRYHDLPAAFLTAYVLESGCTRPQKHLYDRLGEMTRKLAEDSRNSRE